MKPETWEHPNFRRLQQLLNYGRAVPAGILEGVWFLAATFSPEEGRLDFKAEDLQAWMGLPMSGQALLDALVETGWVDRDEHGWKVHDWAYYRPAHLTRRIRDRQYKHAKKPCMQVAAEQKDHDSHLASIRKSEVQPMLFQ